MVLAFGPTPYASHTWSIGTEEQFYIVWPVLFKYLKLNRLFIFSSVVFFYLLFDKFLYTSYSDFIPYRHIIRAFWGSFNISCMAIGAVYATMLFKKHFLIKYLTNNYFFLGTLFLTLILIFNGFRFPKAHYEFYSVLFGIIILNLASSTNLKNVLENKLFNYLGGISYGLYMFHSIAIVISIKLALMINFSNGALIYPLCIFSSVMLAHISYYYFEIFFLRIKDKYL
jgi:peptidoglycan/LPS O-acetylase OafA/YrhL